MAKPEPKGYAAKAGRGERPFIYSDLYLDWKRAVLRNDDRAMTETDFAWRQRYAPYTL